MFACSTACMSTDRPTPLGRVRLPVLLAFLGVAVAVAGVGAGVVIERAANDGPPAATAETTPADAILAEARSTATGSVSGAADATGAVVSILATVAQESGFGPASESVAEGSGFVLDEEGRIVTNDHVVDGASEINVAFADGTKADATLLATDPLLDLAVIQVDVDDATLEPLRLGTAETLRVGETVVAIGNPFGLERSVSAGIVSALGRQITAPNGFTLSNAIQTDAAINHGNSGGPLLDEDGLVIGVNAQIADSGVDANVGIGFAVALDEAAREAIASMARGETVEHAWLGVSLDDVDAILATSGELEATQGALVTGVVAGGPADEAAFRGGTTLTAIDGAQYCLGGDVVVAVDGASVRDAGDLQRAVAAFAPGTAVEVEVVRSDGSRSTLDVELGTQPTTAPEATTGCGPS
jgi:S1-C subfamily serine protease